MVLVVAGQRAPRVGCAWRLLEEALVVKRQASQVSLEALTVLALELQRQRDVCVGGGDS